MPLYRLATNYVPGLDKSKIFNNLRVGGACRQPRLVRWDRRVRRKKQRDLSHRFPCHSLPREDGGCKREYYPFLHI